jgi:hypothetical protein
MMGVFATVVFKRQSFAEKDLRHYIDNIEALVEKDVEKNVFDRV